jgi:hypothetical protein
MKKTMNAKRLLERVPVPEPAGLCLDDPLQRQRAGEHDHADRRQQERQLVGTTWAAARRPPMSEYLLKLDQPPIIRPTTDRPPTAKK